MAKFDPGSGPIFLEALSCTENDDDLLNCGKRKPLGLSVCDHSNDVGVICLGKGMTTPIYPYGSHCQ